MLAVILDNVELGFTIANTPLIRRGGLVKISVNDSEPILTEHFAGSWSFPKVSCESFREVYNKFPHNEIKLRVMPLDSGKPCDYTIHKDYDIEPYDQILIDVIIMIVFVCLELLIAIITFMFYKMDHRKSHVLVGLIVGIIIVVVNGIFVISMIFVSYNFNIDEQERYDDTIPENLRSSGRYKYFMLYIVAIMMFLIKVCDLGYGVFELWKEID